MGTSNQSLFDESSSFPEKFDVLPRLVDGIDFLTAPYWNHLLSGTQKMTSAIGGEPLDYNGVSWPVGVDTIDEALAELSRVDAGIATLYPADQGFAGEVYFTPGRFTRTSGSGSNPSVPFFTGCSPYQDIQENQEADKDRIEIHYAGEFEVVYRYDSASPYGIVGMKIKTNRSSSSDADEMKVAWLAIEAEIG